MKPKRQNIGDSVFPTYRYDLGGETLFVNKAFTKREAREQGRYFARVVVVELGLKRTETVYFKTLGEADSFAEKYLTTGVVL